MLRPRPLRAPLLSVFFVVAVAAACAAPAAGTVSATASTRPPSTDRADTSALIPAGFGSLRQDDISIRVTVQGLSVRAIPLDEGFIRTLSPDSYRTLHELGRSKRTEIDAIVRRTGLPAITVWYVSFFNVQQGEARFSAQDVVLTNMGRDYRPLDILALTPGFGNQRLRQREQAHALFVFDGAVDPNQPITMSIEGQQGGDWRSVVQRVERERALIRSRAGSGTRPPPSL